MKQNKKSLIKRKALFIASLLFVIIDGSFAVERFPRPEFQSDYQFPNVQAPVARPTILEYVDVAVLVLALSAASYLVVKAKTRKGLFPLSIFAILYLGFYRKGCVCAIGSIQNIAYALFANDYAIPLTVILFFATPIVFTLLFGRTFCSHVCPFGGLQDIVHMKTVRLPQWISLPLGIVPYVYLGLSILLAATGSTFVICRFDPFVNLFRLSGDMSMIVFGVVVLSISVFIARPYCRFLCPYGAVLKLMSYFSWKRVEIAEGECSNCGACHKACRYQAIRIPGNLQADESPAIRKRRVAILLVVTLLIIASGGFAGRMMSIPLSRINPQVVLADQLIHPDATATGALSLEAEAFKTTGTSEDELFAEVKAIKDSFNTGGIAFGLFVGIVFSIALIGLAVRKKTERYAPDRLLCFSCGRCAQACPKEKRKR
jgi:NosR/NirI family nitrous oxide reductase transcriptional regulator